MTLATAETSFVASEKRRKRGRGREWVGGRARVYKCERTERLGWMRWREKRGEVNKMPDMVSCERRECHFTYTPATMCTRSRAFLRCLQLAAIVVAATNLPNEISHIRTVTRVFLLSAWEKSPCIGNVYISSRKMYPLFVQKPQLPLRVGHV